MSGTKVELDKSRDLIETVQEFAKYIGDYVHILVGESQYIIEFLAARYLIDLNTNQTRIYFRNSTPDSLYRVEVLDPTRLPFQCRSGDSVWVLFEDWEFKKFETLAEATYYITDCLRKYPRGDITDFAVFMGKKIDPPLWLKSTIR